MTTVAFDGVTIACDSQRTSNNVIDPFTRTPKIWVRNGVVFAGAGTDLWFPAFLEWYGDRSLPYPLLEEDDGSECFVFAKGKWRAYFSDGPHPQPAGKQWAIGSGHRFALTTLYHGMSAVEAVSAAIQLDPFSSAPIFAADLWALVKNGEQAIKELGNGAQAERKSPRTPVALHARKGRGDP